MPRWTDSPAAVRPMLATLADAPLVQPALVYEPKYDGIRALIHVGAARDDIHIWSRLGNDKTSQFPSIVRALAGAVRRLSGPLLVDGEIVALDAEGRPAGFQRLQGRIHLTSMRDVERVDREQPVAFIAFDLLREGDEDLRGLALSERRTRLERRFAKVTSSTLRLSEQAAGDGRALEARARHEGWEGLIAKEARAPYQSGRRSPAWRKIKLLRQEEFVVGGWTEPRQTRPYFGALLLGVYESGGLRYVGHTGTGFDQAELARVWRLLQARTTARSPFSERIKTNEPAHWVRPELVAQVRFTEWTDDHKLRHPVYLGLRDDKLPAEVRHEPVPRPRDGDGGPTSEASRQARRAPAPKAREARGGGAPRAVTEAEASRQARRAPAPKARDARGGGAPRAVNEAGASRQARRAPAPKAREARGGAAAKAPASLAEAERRRGAPRAASDRDGGPTSEASRQARRAPAPKARDARGGGAPRAVNNAAASVVDQLLELEHARRDGTIELPGGETLGVTNLSKIYWPGPKLTKGALLRYYAEVAPLILPAVQDRPLVMKRFPNGISAPAFYQQRSRIEKPPAGVRIETLPDDFDPISEPDARRLVGGSLITLLYMTQIAAISQDPWFSRVQSPLDADYVALDLDPGEETPFSRVLDVARWVRDELQSLKVPAVPKTSGSSGLHVYIPLPPGTSYESGMLFCQIVATVIATRHPKVATVERTVRARGRGTVYVDYLQNILGKTLATAYSARASEFAGVSTPLRWEELDEAIDPRDFTIRTAPGRFRGTGDLWAKLRTAKPANLAAVFRKYGSR